MHQKVVRIFHSQTGIKFNTLKDALTQLKIFVNRRTQKTTDKRVFDKYDNLKTQFIYKSGLLSYYVAERLNNNQKIKRLLKYQTINPLSDKGLTKDNRIVEQPDIEENLLDVNIFDGTTKIAPTQ